MGVPMYLFRITPEQADLDGDSLVRLLLLSRGLGAEREPSAAPRFVEIDTAWQWLGPLLSGAAESPAAAHLAVLGGRAAECSADAPAVVLEPDEVEAAARFLSDASFDQLWEMNSAATEKAYGGRLSDIEVDDLRSYLDELRVFYSAAAQSGDAVMKWMAF